MEKLVSVAIVNWNGEKYLYKCIDSLLNQNYKNIEIIIIDNDSTDSSVKIIEDNFKEKVVLFKNKNTGYAGGANKGIELSNGEYVIIANPDIVFGENYIEKCINKYEEDKRVFGVCGAAAVFKKDALEKIKVSGEYFDNDFFAYKEDIDICWRLNLYGFKCYYVHDAISYHGRGMNSSKGIINTIKNRRSQSEFLKGISFRNHYLMIIKNETNYAFEKDKSKIYIGVMKYLVFFMLFDRKCLKYVKEVKSKRSLMEAKRNQILKNIKISDEEIYKLFDL